MHKKLLVFALPTFLVILLLSTLSATAQSQECPEFGGYPTNPVDDGGCVFAGGDDPGVITSTVPLGWWAQYWNGSETVEAESGEQITTADATFWPNDPDGTIPPVTPEPPVETEEPIDGCPIFGGYASTPHESEPGACHIAWDSDRGVITGTVPQGWTLQHDQSEEIAQPGETVTMGSGTFRPIPTVLNVTIFLPHVERSEAQIDSCPVFGGYASSPVESEPGACSIGWDPDRGVITGTVLQGWTLEYDLSDEIAQPGEAVTMGSGTFRPISGE